MLLPDIVLILTARLQEDLVDHPVLQVITEGHDTHLVYNMQSSRPVEVQDGVKRAGMSIKEVFVVNETVGVTELEDLLVSGSLDQFAQSRLWHL